MMRGGVFAPVLAADVAGRSAADLAAWIVDHRRRLWEMLPESGAVLVRGLANVSRGEFAQLAALLVPDEVRPPEPVVVRADAGDGLLEPVTWPASRLLCPHQEASHTAAGPGIGLIGCLRPPNRGGALLLADGRRLAAVLPDALSQQLRKEGWQLVRNFREHFGPPLDTVFGTSDRDALLAHGAGRGIDMEWRMDGTLRTRSHRPAFVRHPVTGEECWYNLLAFLSEWSLEPHERVALTGAFGSEGLPSNTFFGTGDPISAVQFAALQAAYDDATTPLEWDAGDVVLFDTLRISHGRAPYEGDPAIVIRYGNAPAVPREER